MKGDTAEPAPRTVIVGLRLGEVLADEPGARRYLGLTPDGGSRVVTVHDTVPSDDAIEAYHQAVATATAVRVPGIVAVVDGGTVDGRPYLVEEHVAGTGLDVLIAARSARLDALEGPADALDALHAQGGVHRAVTPRAIVVDGHGAGHLRLTGVALPLADTDPVADGVADEPLYRAPETASGVTSHRSDLYGFGCVAFEVLTGVPAFTLADTLTTGHRPPCATDRRPDLPTAVDAVFAQAFAREPSDRFASATLLVDALRAALGSSYRPRAGRWLRRAVWISGAAALLSLTTAALVLAGVL